MKHPKLLFPESINLMAETKDKLPVFIGRFQPFHLGHLEVVKRHLKRKKFVIVIGSMQEANTPKNPFTFSERKEMIKKVLKSEKIGNYKIFGLPDFMKDMEWSENLLKAVGTNDIVVYTRNNWTKKCLEKSGIEVVRNPLYFGISATKIRSRIKKELEWKSLVPEAVSGFLREIGGERRIKGL